MKHAPLIIEPRPDMAMLRWTLAMLRNCTAARYALNKSRMVRLAEYSRDELIALRGQLGLDYDQRSQGTLQLFRTQKQLDASASDIRSEEPTSELQSLMRNSYAAFCLKKKT